MVKIKIQLKWIAAVTEVRQVAPLKSQQARLEDLCSRPSKLYL